MYKISIVGCGRLGSTVAFSLLPKEKVGEIVLVDAVKNLEDGLVMDMSHAYPEFAGKLKTGWEDTRNSDIVIITAGKSRTKEESREELFETNKKIIADVMKRIKISDKTIVIVVTNPVESLTYLVYKLSRLPSTKVIGFSNILDSSRLCYILSKKTGIDAGKISCYVIGEHGENMLPVYSQCYIGGKRFEEYKLDKKKVVDELRMISKDVIKLLGWTQYGPARHVVDLVDAIVNDVNSVFPVSFYVERNKHYSLENVCISIPVKINRKGIGEVVNLDLNKVEREKLEQVASHLKRVQNNLDVRNCK